MDAMKNREVLESAFWNNISLAYLYVLVFQWYFKVLLNKVNLTGYTVFQLLFGVVIAIVGFTDMVQIEWLRKVFLFFTSIIIIEQFLIVYKYIKNADKNSHDEKTFVLWLKIIFSSACILLLSSVFNVIYNGIIDVKIVVYSFRINTILWLFVCLYILFNPLILYGRYNLEKTLIKPSLDQLKVWVLAPLKSIALADQELHERINSKVPFYLSSINNLNSRNLKLIIHGKPIPVLSKVLGVPVIHLKFIFKYYCNYTAKEFHNYLRIKLALQTIDEGYLDTHTINSLSSFCGFSSRSAFYDNFKKFTGHKVTDFSKSSIKIEPFLSLHKVNPKQSNFPQEQGSITV
jgi:AraC-like DNA-binding protein